MGVKGLKENCSTNLQAAYFEEIEILGEVILHPLTGSVMVLSFYFFFYFQFVCLFLFSF